MAKILFTTEESIQAVRDILSYEDEYINVSGPAARPIMDALFAKVDELGYTGRIQLTLPALTGSESLGSSFLFQLYRLAKKIRINFRATHLMLATPTKAMMLSVGPDRKADNQLIGAIFTDEDSVRAINEQCAALWEAGMMLRLGPNKEENA